MTSPVRRVVSAPAEPDTSTPFGERRAGKLTTGFWSLTLDPRLVREDRKRLRKRHGARFAGPFDVEVDGLRFRAYPAENRDDRALLGRRALPEPDERALLLPFLEPGMVFVDVGANIGTYPAWVARHAGPGARVIAFEPHPRTFAKLVFNMGANGFGNVVCENLAIAGEEGEMELFSDGGGNIGHASLLREGAGTVRASETVKVAPLAATLADMGVARVDLLKIDVEGFEDRALLPLFDQAPEALWPRAILIETVLAHLWETDCLAALEARGYRRAGETAENVLMAREADG